MAKMPQIPFPALALPGFLLIACNDLPSAFQSPAAVRVEITGGSCGAAAPRAIQGRECELVAAATDSNGQPVRAGFAWTTGDTSIATVAPKPGFDTEVAEITGVQVGLTTIRVEIGADPSVFVVRNLSVIPSNNPN